MLQHKRASLRRSNIRHENACAAVCKDALRLYDEIWQAVAARFYDESRLARFEEWRHRYDNRIKDECDALRFARRMVASLGDKYTTILTSRVIETRQRRRASNRKAVLAERLPGNIGCLTILGFDQKDVAEQLGATLSSLSDCEGYIVNLSGNKGGLLDKALDCLEYFVEEGGAVTLETRDESGITSEFVYLSPEASLIATVSPGGKEIIKRYRRKPAVAAGKPLALVVDENTASSAETFAAALIDRSAKKTKKAKSERAMMCRSFGTRTFGKGITQAPFSVLEGKATVQISTGRLYSPAHLWVGDGQNNCPGIEPDVFVAGGNRAAISAACRYLRKAIASVRKHESGKNGATL